jgi:CelD/BcsL family acetyltransferase involved in cellulose biosynthesis
MLSVHEYNDFEYCEKELNDFIVKNHVVNPFVKIEWLKTWWRHYGSGKTLQILFVREGSETIGFAPLYYNEISQKKIREYRFLGHRKGNYLGFCAKLGMDREVFDSVIGYLEETHLPTILTLIDVNSSSSFYKMLEDPEIAESSRYHKYSLYPCPFTQLDQNWETFFKKTITQGKKRTELRKFERKLAALGSLEFETIENPQTLNQVFPYIEQIHNSRFNRTINRSLEDESKNFILDICNELLNKGLNLTVLKLCGIPVSFILGFEMENMFIDYIPAFNPVFSKFSLGHVHLIKLMQLLIEKGIRIFDFSKGEEIYKRKWSTHESWNYSYLFHLNATFLSSLVYFLIRIRTRLILWARRKGYGKRFKYFIACFRNIKFKKKEKRIYKIEVQSTIGKGEITIFDFSYSIIKHLPNPVKQFLVEYHYSNSDHKMELCCVSEDHLTIIDQSARPTSIEIVYR